MDGILKYWNLSGKSPQEIPYDFITDKTSIDKLKDTIKTANRENWYAYCQLGIHYLANDKTETATDCLTTSTSLEPNPWAYHGLSVLNYLDGHHLILDD